MPATFDATFDANGAADAVPVRATTNSKVATASSSLPPLVLALPAIQASPFPTFSHELHHPKRVFALDGMAGTAAAIKTGAVVDVLL